MPIHDRSIDTPECQVMRNQRGVCSAPVWGLSSLSTPQDAHRLCFIYTRVNHGGTLARASGKTQNELKGRWVVCVAPVAISELPFLKDAAFSANGWKCADKERSKERQPSPSRKTAQPKRSFQTPNFVLKLLVCPSLLLPLLKHYNQAFIKILR